MLSSTVRHVGLRLRSPIHPAPNLQKTIQLSSSTSSFDNHTLNCNKALKKSDEIRPFSELLTSPISTLEGIGPVTTNALDQLGISTINDLANYKYFHIAKSISILAEMEITNERSRDSTMNIDRAVDKSYETHSFRGIVDAPVSALQGLSVEKGELWKVMGVVTVGDLARLKFFRWAESMAILSRYESNA